MFEPYVPCIPCTFCSSQQSKPQQPIKINNRFNPSNQIFTNVHHVPLSPQVEPAFIGTNSYYGEVLIGSTSVSKCTSCGKYPMYTSTLRIPSEKTVRTFVKFSESVICPKCKFPTSSKELNGFNFHFCTVCNKMLEVSLSDYRYHPKLTKSWSTKFPKKLEISGSWKICNIYCGSAFLVIETTSNRLLLWGTIGGVKYQGCVSNPGDVRFKSVSCGGSHLAVISSRGELYTCGLGDKGQLGYSWTADMGHTTLRKVPLNSSVVKVCCGYSTTACLMSNGYIMCFGSNMKKLSSGVINLSYSDSDFIDAPTNIMESVRFVELTHSPLKNVFCAKSEDFLVFVWGKRGSTIPEVQFEVSELAEALADMPYTYSGCPREDTVEQLSLHPISLENGKLFGNKSFSDLTLKLADGEFPVHCLVLLSNSSYFKRILSDKEMASGVLDMTSYNPTAYRCLLKYFYKLPLDDLNCEDLFDLHSIACSYKEKELVDSTFKKLKTMINQDTVLKLHAKATSTNAEDVLRECELFLSSPEFKNDLISFVSQDMKNAIAILRMKSGE
uniref:BTB domain-containing protein n=1 Tax=Lygus hesperus TaxID=30085 RepID=A0A0K8S5F4_LYGHE